MFEPVQTISIRADVWDLSLSSVAFDGSEWAFHHGEELWFFDRNGEPLRKMPGKRGRCVFCADGSRWVSGRVVERYARDASQPVMSVPASPEDRRPPLVSVSADGRWLVVAGEQEVVLWDVQGSEASKVFQYPFFMPSGVWFTPDDKRVIVRATNRVIRFDVKRNPAVLPVDYPSVRSWCPDASGKGMIASVNAGFLWRIPWTGASRLTLAKGDFGAVAASPDGRWIAAAEKVRQKDRLIGERLRVIDVKSRQIEPSAALQVERGMLSLAFDRQGTKLYAGHSTSSKSTLHTFAVT